MLPETDSNAQIKFYLAVSCETPEHWTDANQQIILKSIADSIF